MARGNASKVGDTRISANGYHYTRTDNYWRLTHHLIAEEAMGRKLQDDERVFFKDKDKNNLSKDNLIVRKVGAGTAARRKAILEARIAELTAQLEELN